MSSKVTLKELLQLLEEEGVVGDEADDLVEKFMEARRKRKASGTGSVTALARRGRDADAVTSKGEPVDYGDESPEEAKQRWLVQEANDPEGLFAGGMTAGGIFGDGPIPTDSFDPGARARTMTMQAAQLQARATQQQTQLIARLIERLDAAEARSGGALPPAAAAPKGRLPGRRGR